MKAQGSKHLPEIAQPVSDRPGAACQSSCPLVSTAHTCSETCHPLQLSGLITWPCAGATLIRNQGSCLIFGLYPVGHPAWDFSGG